MEIRVVYHDGIKDLVGTGVEMVHLDDSATAASLLSRIAATHPAAVSQFGRLKLGRNGQTINPDAFLNDGDIIDLSSSESRVG